MKRLWGWIKEQIIQDVPEDLATCEFDCSCVSECRENPCAIGEWEKRKTLFASVQFISIAASDLERSHAGEAQSVS